MIGHEFARMIGVLFENEESHTSLLRRRVNVIERKGK